MSEDATRDVFSTDKGHVVFQYPRDLTLDEVRDLESWINIVLRGMKRRARGAEKVEYFGHDSAMKEVKSDDPIEHRMERTCSAE